MKLPAALLASLALSSSIAPLEERTMVVHDVSDLVERLIAAGDGPDSDGPDSGGPEARIAGAHRLAQLVRGWMDPALVEADDVQAVGSDSLVALALPAQHAQVTAFLDRQRSESAGLRVDTRQLELPKGGFAALGCGDPGVPGGGAHAVFESDQAVADLLARAQETYGASPRERLRGLARILAPLKLSATRSAAYVTDWTLETVEPGPRQLAVPVIERVEEGASLDVLAVSLSNGLFGIEATLELSELVRPVRTVEAVLPGTGEVVELALPEISVCSIRARLELRPGSTALLWTSLDGEREVCVLFTIEAVPAAPK